MFSLVSRRFTDQNISAIFPVIENRRFLDPYFEFDGADRGGLPVTKAVCGDLIVVFFIEVDGERKPLTTDMMAVGGFERIDLFRLAKMRLAKELGPLKITKNGNISFITARNGFSASSVIFTELWRQIESDTPSGIVAAFPHRHIAVYAPANPFEVKEFQSAIGSISVDNVDILSGKLYFRENGEWVVHDADG